jgi:hypothetical protein
MEFNSTFKGLVIRCYLLAGIMLGCRDAELRSTELYYLPIYVSVNTPVLSKNSYFTVPRTSYDRVHISIFIGP